LKGILLWKEEGGGRGEEGGGRREEELVDNTRGGRLLGGRGKGTKGTREWNRDRG
jgi:hypothetical protein